jgi:hypothetical protein
VPAIGWQWGADKRAARGAAACRTSTRQGAAQSEPGKFNIALAHLEGDDKHEMERLIRESLAEFPNVATLSFDRLIAPKQRQHRQGRAGRP